MCVWDISFERRIFAEVFVGCASIRFHVSVERCIVEGAFQHCYNGAFVGGGTKENNIVEVAEFCQRLGCTREGFDNDFGSEREQVPGHSDDFLWYMHCFTGVVHAADLASPEDRLLCGRAHS